jgi:hypothetical protein
VQNWQSKKPKVSRRAAKECSPEPVLSQAEGALALGQKARPEQAPTGRKNTAPNSGGGRGCPETAFVKRAYPGSELWKPVENHPRQPVRDFERCVKDTPAIRKRVIRMALQLYSWEILFANIA